MLNSLPATSEIWRAAHDFQHAAYCFHLNLLDIAAGHGKQATFYCLTSRCQLRHEPYSPQWGKELRHCYAPTKHYVPGSEAHVDTLRRQISCAASTI